MATGICAKTWLQAPFDCTRSDSGTWQAGRRWNLSSISACAARCLQCERCAWVSYGRRECAWYASCEHPVDKPAYERMRVRATPPPGPRLEAGHTCGRGRMSKAATPAPLPLPAPDCPATDPASDFLILASGRRRLACIGDSITRGDGAHEAGRGSHAPFKRGIVGRGNYPAALQALLGTEEWLVGNFGVSGRTAMPTGDAYATTREYQSLRCFAPELVVLMLGTNDAKPVHWGPRQTFPHARLVRALVGIGRQVLSLPTCASAGARAPCAAAAPRLLLLSPPPSLAVDALERGLAGVLYPWGGVGLNNFDKHAINTRLTPAVAAAAVKLGVPLLDTRPAFGGGPACLKRPLGGAAARQPSALVLGCSTQHSRGEPAPLRSPREAVLPPSAHA